MQSPEQLRLRLNDTLSAIAGKIATVSGGRRPISEQDTKGTLIEPVLAALGWDLADLEVVRREYKHNKKDLPVDYAFFASGRPIMFLEAKAIGLPIDDHKWMAQIVNYANSAGVEICVLTNGRDYRIFNTHAKVPLQEKTVGQCSIGQTVPEEAADMLECLTMAALQEQRIIRRWEQEQLENSVRAAIQELIQSRDKKYVNLLAASLKGQVGMQHLMDILSRAKVEVSFASGITAKSTRSGTKLHSKPRTPIRKPVAGAVTLGDLIEVGLISTPFQIFTTFKKQQVVATINRDGTVSLGKQTYNSLSVAAGYARNSISGLPSDGRPYYQTNGWLWWSCQYKGQTVLMDVLRQDYLSRTVQGTRSKLEVMSS
ncbi:type I restriction enzyme HsdR N-terminal domain-containing protein [bacterium]|nr:type I restriction enzyme HsdR N-terminal domain-containing protein [bacterium]